MIILIDLIQDTMFIPDASWCLVLAFLNYNALSGCNMRTRITWKSFSRWSKRSLLSVDVFFEKDLEMLYQVKV
jgi:hypothetical protein